ncbi:VIT and vWA domain-containing protein [Neptunomonas qingdaonensis]|uniref:Ca-activated chloride channel family protein n=1 Tax=Neptunomonas qingdaonensis TaxID=1045558 RepID=A0A1I2V9Z9_9GAMM|nr:VIT and VWA domain-containing protein [Neptunomonas qingdaonensis]SFG86148.1 Ca-activated chloride channel family protein [Neptunomonas qingdaonensis]
MLWKQVISKCIGGVLLCAGVSLSAQAAGLMKPVNSVLPDLSIQQHHVNVLVEDGYVTTTVEQVFHNPSNSQLEAKYSFPVPERAAVGEFIYWINGQPVIGEVVAKQQAQQIYQQQKQAGNHVALTEKDGYRTFDSFIYPVEANADVRIKLVYIQAAHLDTNTGRYLYPLEDGGVDEQTNSFWSRNEIVQESFSFNMDIRSSYPLDGVRLPKHTNAIITQVSPQQWTVALSSSAQVDEGSGKHQPAASLSEDILVYWRLEEGLPGSVDLVSYRHPDSPQGTFMLTLTPGDDLPSVQGNRDWTFVLDVSGSMEGKYSTLLEGVRQGLAKLPTEDRFRLITFNNEARDITGGYQSISTENVTRYIEQLQQNGTGGGTNLYAGLAKGLKHLDDDRSTAIVLVTDGVANVGTTEKKDFLKLVQENDVRLFTFIMGNSANRPMLKEMTELSNGFAANISNADDVIGQVMLATSKLNHASMRDIDVSIKGRRVSDLTPEQINTVYRGQQLVLFGHYFEAGPAEVVLSGKVGAQERVYRAQVELADVSKGNPELERFWAYSKIEALQKKMDYLGADADSEQAITDLAVEYGLVTDYTSLLVVEEEVFEQLAIQRTNKLRVNKEQQARQQRNKREQVQDNRAGSNQPMFKQPRASTGSGAIDSSLLLLLLALGLPSLFARFKASSVAIETSKK